MSIHCFYYLNKINSMSLSFIVIVVIIILYYTTLVVYWLHLSFASEAEREQLVGVFYSSLCYLVQGHGLGCDTWNDQVEGQKKVGMSTPRIVNYVKAWTKGEKPNNWVGK